MRGVPLEYLSEEAVTSICLFRFPANRFPVQLAGLIHERTEGNRCLLVNAVDYLVGGGLIAEHDKECWELVVEIENVQVGVPTASSR